VEEMFPGIRLKDGVGKIVKTQLLQNFRANVTTRRQTQQRNLNWTTDTVNT